MHPISDIKSYQAHFHKTMRAQALIHFLELAAQSTLVLEEELKEKTTSNLLWSFGGDAMEVTSILLCGFIQPIFLDCEFTQRIFLDCENERFLKSIILCICRA